MISTLRLRLTLVAVLAVATCANLPASAKTLAEAKENGLVIGYAGEPPYSFMGPDGSPAGPSNEIIIAVAKKLGITKIEGVLTEFASLIPGLKAERFDVTTDMFLLAKRCKEVAFSNPMWKGESAFLVAAVNPKQLHSYDDAAKRDDVILGVMAGAAEQDYARKAGVPEDRIMLLQDPPALLEAVKSKRIDAVALTPGSVQSMADKSGGAAERALPFTTPPYAIAYSGWAFRKDDTELREAFNATLKEIIGTPEFLSMLAPQGYAKENLPGDTTADEACARP